MENSKPKQRKFYDVRYSSFQRAFHKLHSPFFAFYDNRLIELLFRDLSKKENLKVLDVGTGQGTDPILLSKKADQVVGIDISREAIKTANTLAHRENNLEIISFVVGDAEHLPFKADEFDIVCCKDMLHHVSDPLRTILEMKRVAKEDGNIMAIEANALNPQMIVIGIIYFSVDKGVFQNTKSKFQRLFLKAGLTRVSVVETEFLPRHMLFEYRSPINRLIGSRSNQLFGILKKIETNWQKHDLLREFSNYLLVIGSKNKQSKPYE